jgi:hypothetical protein
MVAGVLSGLADLSNVSEPERACLDFAWQALVAGTIPVGVVVAKSHGLIIGSDATPSTLRLIPADLGQFAGARRG